MIKDNRCVRNIIMIRWSSHDGDLRSRQNRILLVLHNLYIPRLTGIGAPIMFADTLNLSVGGTGIIGRRIILTQKGSLLGEGIIGWN